MGRVPRQDWLAELKRFNERNTGRQTILEIDEPAIGAQREAMRYELRGVDYDARDDSFEIMLGDGDQHHLTHTVHAARELDILDVPASHEEVLRIGYADGQAVLRVLDTPGQPQR